MKTAPATAIAVSLAAIERRANILSSFFMTIYPGLPAWRRSRTWRAFQEFFCFGAGGESAKRQRHPRQHQANAGWAFVNPVLLKTP
jgi:hypothetical protein